MKKTNILYWIFTGLLCALMLLSSIPGLMNSPDAIKMIETHLGYPHYLLIFISVAKLLGVVALLVPGFARIKEWAYAGFTFDLVAAAVSFIAVGDPFADWAFVIVALVIVGLSYYFHHKRIAQK